MTWVYIYPLLDLPNFVSGAILLLLFGASVITYLHRLLDVNSRYSPFHFSKVGTVYLQRI